MEALTIRDLEKMLGARVDEQSLRALERHGAGMQIDKAFLEQEIRNLTEQRNNAAVTLHQANGAIHAYEALIARLEAPEPSAEPSDDQDDDRPR